MSHSWHIFNSKDSDKWVLFTGTIVDDMVKQIVEELVHKYPVHSLIFDRRWTRGNQDNQCQAIKYILS